MPDHPLRRALLPPAGWLAGVGVQLQQAVVWPVAATVAAMVGGAVLLVGASCARGLAAAVLALLGAGLLGFGVAGGQAALRLADTLPTAMEGVDLVLTGTVAALPEQVDSGTRFRFDVDSAQGTDGPVAVPPRLSLGWYRGFHDDATTPQPGRALVAGQRWRLTARLRRPSGNLNPNGRDVELLLFEQGVRATGYMRDRPAPRLVGDTLAHPVERLRQRVRDAIVAAVPDHRAAGVLAALAVGDQSAIAADDWDVFRAAGIAHVISISGVHITMFAWIASRATASLWRRGGRTALRWPAVQAGRAGGVVAAAGYALLSGWGVPAQRTVWMLAVVAGLQIGGRRWPWPGVLLVAATVVTAFDPWALLQPGFWLSFMAVGLLMASGPGADAQRAGRSAQGVDLGAADGAGPHPLQQAGRRSADGVEPRAIGSVDDPGGGPASSKPVWRRWARAVWQHQHGEWRAQTIATVGLAPLTLVCFQQLSVVGFAANVVAIPLVTFVVTPLSLLGIVWAPLWSAAAAAVQVLTAWLGWLTAWPAAVWRVPVAPLWAQLAGLVGAAVAMLPLPWRLRLLAVPLVAPLLWPPPDAPPPGAYDLIAADVGQGSAVLVRTAHHVLVYDSGPAYSAQADAGGRVLVPLLASLGIARVDRLVLSHRDLDHVGGARSLFQAVAVGDLLSSLEATHPLLRLAPSPVRCSAGQTWDWDGVRFSILQPARAAYPAEAAAAGANGHRSNALSCVLKVESASSGSALLVGDIERDQEAALLRNAPGSDLRSDVLLVPHHGSRTSSTDAFIAAVAPRIAVVQAGYRNRFGHPAPDVVARYRARGIEVVASPDCGAWVWHDRRGTCWRETHHRYWHRPPPDAPTGPASRSRVARTPGVDAPANGRNGLNFATLALGRRA